MSYLHDDILDAALQVITDATSKVMHICTAEPTSRAEAISLSVGNKNASTVSSPTNGDTNGRKVTISAIADGTVTTEGDPTHWALIDDTRLLAAEALGNAQTVYVGNPWTLPATDITLPDA